MEGRDPRRRRRGILPPVDRRFIRRGDHERARAAGQPDVDASGRVRVVLGKLHASERRADRQLLDLGRERGFVQVRDRREQLPRGGVPQARVRGQPGCVEELVRRRRDHCGDGDRELLLRRRARGRVCGLVGAGLSLLHAREGLRALLVQRHRLLEAVRGARRASRQGQHDDRRERRRHLRHPGDTRDVRRPPDLHTLGERHGPERSGRRGQHQRDGAPGIAVRGDPPVPVRRERRREHAHRSRDRRHRRNRPAESPGDCARVRPPVDHDKAGDPRRRSHVQERAEGHAHRDPADDHQREGRGLRHVQAGEVRTAPGHCGGHRREGPQRAGSVVPLGLGHVPRELADHQRRRDQARGRQGELRGRRHRRRARPGAISRCDSAHHRRARQDQDDRGAQVRDEQRAASHPDHRP